MKRLFFLLLVAIFIIATVLFFKTKRVTISETVLPVKLMPTNIAAISEETNLIASQKPIDISQVKSIAEWTNAIRSFKASIHSVALDSWFMEQKDPAKYPSIFLTGTNGETIHYKSNFINIESTDQINRIEIHSPNLNIEETKSLGDSLLRVMGKDRVNFNTWCDKVGNHWMDQPPFSSGNMHLPNDERTYVFETLSTFNNEKPWYVLLTITTPQPR